jgi:hypothetical protein
MHRCYRPLSHFLLLFVPQYGRLAAISLLLAFNHSACLRNARRISYHRCHRGIFTSSERPQQNKTSPSPFPVLVLPEFRSVSRCEGRKCIVLGLCNASLLSSLSHFLLLFLLFVPQYGRLAAVF